MKAKNMANASLQEIFNHVVSCLKEQGQPSMESGECCYRTNNGLKCAAGFCIADEDYSETMEDIEFDTVCDSWESFDYSNEQVGLITRLQLAHDTWGNDDHTASVEVSKKTFNREFAKVANAFSLEFEEWE